MAGSRFTIQARLEGPFPSKKGLEREAAEWRRLGYKVRLGKDKHGFWLIRQPRKGLARNPEPPLEQRVKELYALSMDALRVQVKQIYRVVDVRGASKDVLASMILEAEGYYRKRKAPAPNPRPRRNLSPGAHREHYEQDMLLAGYAARQGKARSALYYGGRAKGHRFSAGDEGPTPYNPTAKELGDNPGKPFAWKRLGKMGDFVVRLRFNDERRGEAFFDRAFAAFQPLGRGVVGIGAEVVGGGYDFDGLPATLAELQNALRPGTQLTLAPSWVSPRGRRDLYWLRVTISSAERQKNVVVVRYSQASGAAPNPAEDYLHVFRHGGRWFVQFSSSSACPGRPGAVAAEYPDRRTAEVRASRLVDLYKRRVKGGKVKVLVHGGPGVNPGRRYHLAKGREARDRYNHQINLATSPGSTRAARRGADSAADELAGEMRAHERSAADSPFGSNPGTSIDQVVRDPEYQKALKLYRKLHGCDPTSLRRVILPIGSNKRITGRAFFVDMGEAPSESYEPDDPRSKKHGKLWVHAYERHGGRRPRKLVSADGKLILTAPGAHRVRAGADGEAWIHG